MAKGALFASSLVRRRCALVGSDWNPRGSQGISPLDPRGSPGDIAGDPHRTQ